MKFFCSLLIAGSMSAFAQDTPSAPVQDKGAAHASKAEHPHKAHKKHKKHHAKKHH